MIQAGRGRQGWGLRTLLGVLKLLFLPPRLLTQRTRPLTDKGSDPASSYHPQIKKLMEAGLQALKQPEEMDPLRDPPLATVTLSQPTPARPGWAKLQELSNGVRIQPGLSPGICPLPEPQPSYTRPRLGRSRFCAHLSAGVRV